MSHEHANSDRQQINCTQVFVVPHTHWDREWYWSLAGFRSRLVDLMDDVIRRLQNPRLPDGLEVFWMDGQVVPLLDYLETKLENEEILQRLVSENRLRIGPWFVQADEHLVDGEGCVRNLLLGRFYGSRFGPIQNVGYVPDQFGHTAQMPQILAKAGIDNAVFWRGLPLPREGNLLLWQAPDGSRVRVLLLQNGYSNAADLPTDLEQAVEKLAEVAAKEAPLAPQGNCLLMAGVDHALPASNLKEAAERLAEKIARPVRIAGLDEAVAAARSATPCEEVTGELLFSPGLYGCWSSRIYLKQANDRISRILEFWSEPLAALALAFAGYDLRSELRTAWKELVLNHPHDSICGCSVDPVHRAMMTRFEIAETLALRVAERSTWALQLAADGRPDPAEPLYRAVNRIQDRTPTFLNIWNGSGCAIDFAIPLEVVWPETEPAALKILDPSGRRLEVQVLDHGPHRFRRWRPNANPTRHVGRKFVLVVKPTEPIPAFGWSQYRIEPAQAETLDAHTVELARLTEHAGPSAPPICRGDNCLENEHLRVEVRPDGACDILHKATGTAFRRTCRLIDLGEAGDSYTYIKPRRDLHVLPEPGTITVAQNGPLYGQIEVRTVLRIPEGLSDDKRGRSNRFTDCPVAVRYCLAAGCPYLEVRVEFENRADNHLLRMLFTLPEMPDHHYAATPFASLRRSRHEISWRETERGWTPLTPDGWPQLGWIDLPAEPAGLAIFAPGLPHYGFDETPAAWINLLRCFGELIWAWSPMYPVPEGQCHGLQRFRLAVYPHAGDYRTARVPQLAQAFALPVRATLGDRLPREMPVGSPLIEIQPACVRITAFKPAETEQALVLRLLNDSQQPTSGTVRLNLPVKSIVPTDLLERPIESSAVKVLHRDTVALNLKPLEFVTLKLHLQD